MNEYINGYIQLRREGRFEGSISIEGIDLGEINGMFFEENDKKYLWLKRKDMLDYNPLIQAYVTRVKEPRWEAYLEKKKSQGSESVVEYYGEFYFLRFKFSIKGLWDKVMGMDKQRMNFYVERLPMERQDIINRLTNK